MKLSEIVSDIINIYEGGRPSDDILLERSQIEFWVHQYRARLIKEYVEKRGILSPNWFQEVPCVDLVCLEDGDFCCGLGINSNLKKLAVPLPNLVELPFRSPIEFVGLIDRTTRIDLISDYSFQWKIYDKWTKNEIYGTIVGNQIYFRIPDGKMLKKVSLRLLLANPMDIAVFNCNGNYCNNPSDDYPIPLYLVQILKEMIITKELNYISIFKSGRDITNDSVSVSRNIQQPTPKQNEKEED